ncbi:uncharacterized protein PGTG_00764 [Puccinia graminis f. sp. tritici CRL 75-36-700-3]|uniref:Uncharacterized protein n=1 Tax=Puccinia graminis f. sp. tritici (strain CRL 75-36-700-3 / race SCCL) TaxID=418459 RepID=E3JTP0_PUCGT|nr:uncharacterized protein PGTG_00764 [Puccinia graminis f. sp. tritici CRL 75-36-700-3]EFP75433.1 hypothetical protein PGTG_00764 [Puccinia graminis f. sp. tritici CRL 75-36-700-3]
MCGFRLKFAAVTLIVLVWVCVQCNAGLRLEQTELKPTHQTMLRACGGLRAEPNGCQKLCEVMTYHCQRCRVTALVTIHTSCTQHPPPPPFYDDKDKAVIVDH